MSECREPLRRYSLHGVAFEVSVSSPSPQENLDVLVEQAALRFGLVRSGAGRAAVESHSEAPGPLRVRVTVQSEIPDVPEGVVPVALDSGGTVYRCTSGPLYVGEGLWVRVFPEARTACIVVQGGFRGGTDRVDPAVVTPRLYAGVARAAIALLRGIGRSMLHAACLAMPQGPGCLILGPSGSGKSTLSLGLVRGGWGYLSDDLVLLHDQPDGVEAQALLTHFSLFPHARVQFPEIAAAATPRGQAKLKWSVDVRALYPGRVRTRCRPGLLLLPSIVDATQSRLASVPPAAAVGAVLGQLNLATDSSLASRQLALVHRLVGQCRCFRLEAGRDLKERPVRLSALLSHLTP